MLRTAPPSSNENSSEAAWSKAHFCETVGDVEEHKVWKAIAEFLWTLESIAAGRKPTKQ